MIISFKRRFVFVAIPKTGTHAVREALRPHLGPHDWEQCDLFERKRFPVASLAAVGHGHITCREARWFLVGDIWNYSFKFCFVRHPVDRFVSCCHFAHRGTDRMTADPLGTMKRTFQSRDGEAHVLFRPQSEFVTDPHGSLMVDYVGRVESMDADYRVVCERIGVEHTPLERVNASGSAKVRQFVDHELSEMIDERYARDFELFGYAASRVSAAV